jgi:hypothetical protein
VSQLHTSRWPSTCTSGCAIACNTATQGPRL